MSPTVSGPGASKFGVRHIQTVLLFFLLFICNALRTNLSVAIVAMTDKTTNEDFEVRLYFTHLVE